MCLGGASHPTSASLVLYIDLVFILDCSTVQHSNGTVDYIFVAAREDSDCAFRKLSFFFCLNYVFV